MDSAREQEHRASNGDLLAGEHATGDLQAVPRGLVALVVVLLVAVLGLGGYMLRSATLRDTPDKAESLAIAQAKEALAAHPKSASSFIDLGFAYQQAAEYDQALDAYDAALVLDPTSPGALYNRGIVLQAQGKQEEAEAAFRSVLEVAPDHVLAAKALAARLIDLERFADALDVLGPVIEAQPHYADLQYLAGLACEELGQRAEASAYYDAALRYSPDHTDARKGLDRLGGE